ncbi:hypothetical protein QYE76_011577 [Lolium multiflorum]|uniref:Hexosyltransferase n=1 Tax=Lolium multiflorum TaxID=4521 RepID=A0AAD8X453_LOLMU|nr:hypothetical protein QYE76_011577 [Lolium multiflorum]
MAGGEAGLELDMVEHLEEELDAAEADARRGATSNSILDKATDAQHHDFLRLDNVEGYHELSAKAKIFFSTAVGIWDADFYVKVDDDVHVNLDCEWKGQAGNVCVASFDWSCSGICKSVERLKDVHARCGEGDSSVWSALI